MKKDFLTLMLLFGTSFVSTNAFAPLSPIPSDDKVQSGNSNIGRIVLCNKEISTFCIKDGVLSVLANKKGTILVIITNLETEENTTTSYEINVGSNEIPLDLPQSRYSITVVDSNEVISTATNNIGQ